MNLEWYRSAIAVAEKRRFTRAARLLDFAPSTVRYHVRELERCLGAAIFQQDDYGDFVVTDAGHRVVMAGRRILHEHDGLVSKIKGGDEPMVIDDSHRTPPTRGGAR
jgi:DNA-binding transcriptional LysR family regulator